ncbi:DUF1983 domain-containing protein [Escherichia coli]|nr:DUF1983 domain-containing protein [Escherichia coli]
MATKEENQKHLRQLAGLLGREADMSGSAADIAQRVSEWEEELAASREGIMPGDESGPEQNHTDDGEQLHNTDATDDVKAVRVRKCLHVMGYCPETGRPVELTYRGMRVLVPSPLATAMIPYVAGIGAGIEDTDGQPLSNILLLADRIAMINPEDGNTTPLFVAQGNQLFMNDVFLKRLFAVSITSSGNPPTFSLTPEGRLTARNADISGNVNANSGTLNNVTINENCRVLGKLSANQIEGDLVKTVGKAFPRDSRAPERWPSGTITVRVYDDQPFDRQIVIPAVAFSGAKHEREHTDIYSSCRLIVRKNGAEIYNRTALDNTLIYSGVIDMPAGHGHMTLEFSVSAWLVNNWYPTASISDLLVVVMKKSTAGISIS